MARFPNIERSRRNNKQSFSEWIQIFTAQLEVLDIDEEKFKQTLLCLKAKHLHSFLSVGHPTTMQFLQI